MLISEGFLVNLAAGFTQTLLMHLGHDPMDCSEDNLRALCQRCHLRYDARQHAANAARTRRRKRIASGQADLL